MKYETALGILQISDGATPEEVQAAYAERAKIAHPDMGGSEAAMRELNAARDVALAETADLLPARAVRALVEAQSRGLIKIEDRRRAETQARAAVRALVRHETREVVEARRAARLAAATAGGIAALTVILRAVAVTDPSSAVATLTTGAIAGFGILGALAYAYSWAQQFRLERIEESIEEAADALGERSTWLAVFAEIEDVSGVAPPWADRVLPAVIAKWLEGAGRRGSSHETVASLGGRVGEREFLRLFLAKGRELGLLSERVSQRGPRPTVIYELDLGDR